MLRKVALMLGDVLLLSCIVVGCGGSSQEEEAAAEITSFEPPEEVIQAGGPAIASVRVKNTGSEDHTLWIGCSVRDPAGEWHDAPASPVDLDSGE